MKSTIFVTILLGSSSSSTLTAVAGLNSTDLERVSSYWSTSVIDGDDNKDFQIRLTFDNVVYENRIMVSGGCNGGQGTYSIDKDDIDGSFTLVVSDMGVTEIWCGEEGQERDDFIYSFVTSEPSIEQPDDSTLVLTKDDIKIEFVDRKILQPDLPIVGTKWHVDGFNSAPACDECLGTSSSYSIRNAWAMFDDNGTLSYFDECAHGERSYNISRTDTILFGIMDEENLEGECSEDDAAKYEMAVSQFAKVFGNNDVMSITYKIDGPRLDVENGNGDGVSFRAKDEASLVTSISGEEGDSEEGDVLDMGITGDSEEYDHTGSNNDGPDDGEEEVDGTNNSAAGNTLLSFFAATLFLILLGEEY